jgi:hypothetical protein
MHIPFFRKPSLDGTLGRKNRLELASTVELWILFVIHLPTLCNLRSVGALCPVNMSYNTVSVYRQKTEGMPLRWQHHLLHYHSSDNHSFCWRNEES